MGKTQVNKGIPVLCDCLIGRNVTLHRVMPMITESAERQDF